MICGFVVNANSFPKSVQKKIDKTLIKLYPNKVIELSDMELSEELATRYASIKKVKVSALRSGGEELGFACFASSKGKNDYFDYMVIFDKQLLIKKVVVLVYRSTYGGEIMSRSWLKQFIGKTRGESMEMNKDIDGISGATLSAPSITQGVKDLSLLIAEIQTN